jgi:hypothetical protein
VPPPEESRTRPSTELPPLRCQLAGPSWPPVPMLEIAADSRISGRFCQESKIGGADADALLTGSRRPRQFRQREHGHDSPAVHCCDLGESPSAAAARSRWRSCTQVLYCSGLAGASAGCRVRMRQFTQAWTVCTRETGQARLNATMLGLGCHPLMICVSVILGTPG